MKSSLIFLLLSLLVLCISKDKDVITTVEELQELLDSKSFELYDDYNEEDINLKSLFGGDECLVDKNTAKTMLKNTYEIDTTPDKNLRFILGKCNPVLLVPGVYATKLVVEVNCKGLYANEKESNFRNLRIFCGDTVCKDTSVTSEEHPLFVALLDKAFSILGGENDKYSTCLGFFMNFFQNQNECPKSNGKNLCNYSPYIKVGFYGGSTITESKSRCGVEGVQDIIQSGLLAVDNLINIGAAQSYKSMINAFVKRGYEDGFSLGGLPNDYRRYLATNNFSKKVFRKQIERLYANTGKPVVVIGHSYGTLLTLNNLVDSSNKDLLPKIKKFIAIAPPFAGAGKLMDVFLHGMDDWNKSFDVFGKQIHITNYNKFGQHMMYKSLPTLMELRPQASTSHLFTDDKYKDFADAVRGRINIENKCKNTNCISSVIKTYTSKFDNIFKGYFPSLNDADCAYEESVGGNKETLNRKCYTGLYNVGDCPTILAKSSSFDPSENAENYCNQNDKTKFYYQGDCNSNKQCLDDVYTKKSPYVFSNVEAVKYLINRYNNNFASDFSSGKISNTYFETLAQIRSGLKSSLENQEKISLLKDLPAPPVDTDIIYGSYAATPNAFIYDANNFTNEGKVINRGGDDTVPTWSSLLTGLKWIYDKQKNHLTPKYKLVEYCSRLAKDGQYKFDATKNQNFIALSCKCLNSKNEYKNSINDCTHASMINDESTGSMIDYVMSVVDDPKVTPIATQTKRDAVKAYDKNRNYLSECNRDLHNILKTAK